MQITDELLDKVAKLSKLEIPAEKREQMKGDFQKMLDFVARLQEIDTEGIEPLIHMTQEVNRLREDVPSMKLDRGEVLKNAPDQAGDHFRVPKILKK